MESFIFRFVRNLKVIHTMSIVGITPRKKSKQIKLLVKSKEFLKYKAKADYVQQVEVVDEDFIIKKYDEIMMKYIELNCAKFGITPCEKENIILKFRYQDHAEIAKARGVETSCVSNQFQSAIKRLREKSQKVNSEETVVRILIRKP